MYQDIYKIREIRDNKHGESIVNSLLQKGWILISAFQVGTPNSMDIVYVVGATKDIIEKENSEKTKNPSVLDKVMKELP